MNGRQTEWQLKRVKWPSDGEQVSDWQADGNGKVDCKGRCKQAARRATAAGSGRVWSSRC